jgi:transposase
MEQVKTAEGIMEILAAYDLTESYRDAAKLAGCDHHTVARYVAAREAGQLTAAPSRRAQILDPYRAKVEEWVEASHGRVRADAAQRKLEALGYAGSERTTRRVVAEAKAAYRAGHRRRFRPWLPEPGLWLQWDYGDGPLVEERKSWLFCAWLAWSRYRVVLPIRDKTLPTLLGCLDTTLRAFGGVPTYGLTDNEKPVTVEHVARIAVRHPTIVAFGRHYGLTIATCVIADPQSKGGSEATVRIASADLVPTDANLRPAYHSFAELREACAAWCEEVNAREHRATRCPPIERLGEEQTRLHPLPDQPYTAAFGVTRRVGQTVPVLSFEGGEYSVPDQHTGAEVWVRTHDEEIVVVRVGPEGPTEVARHQRTVPGQPRHDPTHFGPAPPGPLARTPRARTADEAAFLALGPGAEQWLVAAAAAGTARMRRKMAAAVGLARFHGPDAVDTALGTAADLERFGADDLLDLVRHQASGPSDAPGGAMRRATEQQSLQAGTRAWTGFGTSETGMEAGR